MAKPVFKNSLKHLRVSDIRGLAQLAAQATLGVSHMAEGMHQAVWRTLGAPGGKMPGQTRGMTRLVYQSMRSVTRLIGKGVDTMLTRLLPQIESTEEAQPGTPQREAVLAALNGVLGDRLAASNNPLATPMTLRYQGHVLNWQSMPQASGKVLLLVHGLCMNDLQWHTELHRRAEKKERVIDHGEALSEALGYTPVYLRYNSGLHTSQNGHELSALLEQWITHWPAPIEELTVLAHSMGGLLIRSAFHYAKQDDLHWPRLLKNIVFLGTPHHGTPLERAGNWVDSILESTPYTAPFATLTQLRSAGITDLRYGHVLDVDWQGHNRFHRKPDNRRVVPLPEGVRCFAVAATTASMREALADRRVSDGLVPLRSALGQHENPKRTLAFAKMSQWIAYRTNHMALLSSPAVTRQLVRWLTPSPS